MKNTAWLSLKIIGLVILVLGAAGLLAGCGSKLLIVLDKYHVCFETEIISRLGADNYFQGDLWFSAAATIIGAVISAVPGLLCGILALRQTNRLHLLEDRYHKPVMELEQADLRFYSTKILEDGDCSLTLDRRKYCGILQAAECGNSWLMDLHVVFHIKNEITLKSLRVQRIVFSLNGRDYKTVSIRSMKKWKELRRKFWEFERRREENQTVYVLDCCLCIFQPRWESMDLWKELEEFVYYSERGNFGYRYIDIGVYIIIQYEYNGKKGTEALLQMTFKADENKSGQNIVENQTANGYFTYDSKPGKDG